jgi:hypothetical protein
MEQQLSPSSNKQYTYMISLLEKKLETGIVDILKRPQRYINIIQKNYTQLQTQKAFLCAICNLLKQEENKQHPQTSVWCGYCAKVNQQVRDRYEEGMASSNQQDTYIPWTDITNKLQELHKTSYASKEHLLLAMYVLEPPKRQDYGDVLIITDSSVKVANPKQNYVLLATTSENKPKATLFMRSYKTDKKYGELVLDLDNKLAKVIAASILLQPRKYLFESRGGKPYTDTAFAKFTSRTFEKLFKKGVTVNTLRHSIIKHYYENPTTSHKDRVELSRRMCHSIDMQSAYAYDVSKDVSKD